MSNRELQRYRDRRDFAKSPEPDGGSSGGGGRRWRKDSNPIFVIQQHDARNLHFDVRLQVGDVLASWAVPKGPSTDPRDKRLAVRTEDHPLDYADFEGTIPEGEYGGGKVLVWDAGPFRCLKTGEDGEPVPLEEALDGEAFEVWLEGRKLRGGYAFVHARVGGGDDNWLLVKMDDEGADARRNPVSTEPESVLSGRTIDELEDPGPDTSDGADG